jgi:hypothetical protein
MIVQMVDPVLQQMSGEHAGFHEVEDLPHQALQARSPRCQRQPQGPQVPARPAQRGALRGKEAFPGRLAAFRTLKVRSASARSSGPSSCAGGVFRIEQAATVKPNRLSMAISRWMKVCETAG